ncbi:AMP-binding protein [Stella sp.]|uniref:AMP-binding protein n=1 Tax=Stella sp. TaxID=2912054 RepID=UPI0035AF5955
MNDNPATRLSPTDAAAVGMHIAIHAAAAPDRLALDGPLGRRSYGELNAACNRLVRLLRSRGLQAGDAIALLAPNRPEFVEVIYAGLRAGFRVTPLNWHMVADEATYVVGDCEAKVLVADPRFAAVAGALAAALPAATKLALGEGLPGFESYDAALAGHPGHDIADPVLGSSMLYTSGTTGRPKGVHRVHSPMELLGAILKTADLRPGDDLALNTGPLYHAAPLRLNLQLPLNNGVGVYLMDKWTPEEMLAVVAARRITHTHAVPTMFHRLLALPEAERRRHDLSSLRWLLHGAAPCPPMVKQAMIDWLGPVLYEYYAGTEGGGTFIDSHEWLRRPGSIGRPAAGCRVEVHDEEGRVLPPGQSGRIFVYTAPEKRFVYFKDPAKTAAAWDGDWFTMGDVGYTDAEGYFFLSGRSAETIISGGVNIYPAEIDAVLLQHPAVEDVATVGAPDDEWGEAVVAVVKLAPGHAATPATGEAIRAFCRGRIADFKVPRRVDFVDALPRMETGKIQRHLVRGRYWQGRDRKI